MQWADDRNTLRIPYTDFSYDDCLLYLNRNAKEILHVVDMDEKTVTKCIHYEDTTILFRLQNEENQLVVSFPEKVPHLGLRSETAKYIIHWLDLDIDLQPFYEMAAADHILARVVQQYRGLRIVGVEDLFEALCWAVMGQQVSLHVAYLLKQRFVEAFGESRVFEGHRYWTFPTFKSIARLNVEDLISLKFTQRKAEYVLGIAKLMEQGHLSKDELLQDKTIEEMETRLTAIRGIGKWSANYVIMRCLRHPDAFPAADVGLHNALKQVLKLDHKPTMEQIDAWSKHWSPWKSYATFYLWRSLMA